MYIFWAEIFKSCDGYLCGLSLCIAIAKAAIHMECYEIKAAWNDQSKVKRFYGVSFQYTVHCMIEKKT